MANTVIEVEGLSKQYRLGEVGRKTLHDDVNRWLHRIMGRSDPYLKIGEENETSKKGSGDYVWALKDINFKVCRGDVLGIIGRNGAGKSTLLKILSKVTVPTTGQIKIKGRIASLLEVGTGFHPELSGRNNIFLNGAILGMTKKEIQSKFDEIVDFSGVERYIDTPVKRYSSGMYVRLAFAVAAYLEPDILIVDEVLAVGDAEFQKKCLGKMKDVSEKDGRTVLFVSHNMEAIIKLCSRIIYLKNGLLVNEGLPANIINNYLKSGDTNEDIINLEKIKRLKTSALNQNVKFKSVKLINGNKQPWKLEYKEEITFQFNIEVRRNLKYIEIGIGLSTINDFEIVSSLSSDDKIFADIPKGNHVFNFTFRDLHLLPNLYKAGFGIRSESGFEDYLPYVCQFEVLLSEVSAQEKAATRKGIIVSNVSCTID